MPLDESLAFYWASIGFSAAGVLLFLWLMQPPKERPAAPERQDRPASAEAENLPGEVKTNPSSERSPSPHAPHPQGRAET